MTVAQFRGGAENWREHFGWTKDRHMLADLFDVLQVNTEATGHWKRKPPELPRYPRPKIEKKRDKPLTVAEVYRAWAAKAVRSEGSGVIWQGS